MFGKDSKKKELIQKLGDVYKVIQRDYNISAGDFPSLEKMKATLEVRLSVHAFCLLLSLSLSLHITALKS